MSNPNPSLKPALPAPPTKPGRGRRTRRHGRPSPDSTRPWRRLGHSTYSTHSHGKASRSTGAYAFPAGHLGGSQLIVVSGEIDLSTADALYRRLRTLAGHPPHQISLDLSRVTFIDCAGLHVLDGMARLVRKNGGSLGIGRVSRAVARLFELADWHPSGQA